jgi:hypothetical protein
MIEIQSYTVEKLEDPFGILSGERFEYVLEISVPEEDELYTDKGLLLRVIYVMNENQDQISKYEIIENETQSILDFELEEDELTMILQFCREHTDVEYEEE